MIIYKNDKIGFIDDVEKGIYVEKIKRIYYEKTHKHTGNSEIVSWINSIRTMKDVVIDDSIPSDAGIAIEYNIPNTSKRVDFIISGYDEKQKEELIFIELKQWQEIEKVDSMSDIVKTVLGGSKVYTNHPSYQAWSYTEFIKNCNEHAMRENVLLSPCSYLHNYYPKENDDPIIAPCYKNIIEKAPVFRMTEAKELREFIKKHIKYGDKLLSLQKLEEGKLQPSKSLQDCLKSMLKGNPEFTLIDDQKIALEFILANACKSRKDNKKRVIIVQGGPGTGKTVVAINLLVKAINEKIWTSYVTKNLAPREVFYKKLVGNDFKSGYIKNMFMGSGSFINCGKNTYGLLICDEAHRLNEKSGMFSNLGENQIKEIIFSSLTSVFFIDEEQVVTSRDIGSVEEITKWANQSKAKIDYLTLSSQFRCGGSDGYLSWLDNSLQIRDTANITLDEIPYDFKVFDNPKLLEKTIREKNKIDGKSRLVAGYCWNWISKKDNTLMDITIDDFSMQWNLNSKQPFAIDENSINQIGCIHTTQGLEFSYVGVILGEDILYENGQVITDFKQRAKTDQSLKGLVSKAKKGDKVAIAKTDIIIRNTYRTLMSRGMKGCYIYCCDKALNEYFKEISNFSYPMVAEKEVDYIF